MEKLTILQNEKVTTKDGREFTKLVGGFGENKAVMTDKQVAELLGYAKGAREVRERVSKNLKHFDKGIHIIDIKKDVNNNRNILQQLGYSEQAINLAKNIYAFSESGFLLYLTFADVELSSEIELIIKKYFNSNIDIQVISIRYEKSFKELLNVIFNKLYVFETQKSIFNGKYRIDFYEPKLNLAIEYDEEQHNIYNNKILDKQRQQDIENELGCSFIRVEKNKEFEGINKIVKYIINNLNSKIAA